jgi:hypothetical protein
MKFSHLKRTAVMAGLVCASLGAMLLAPAAAQANVTNPPQGTQPGNITLTPGTSTDYNIVPNFQTTTPCPAPNNSFAFIVVIGNDGQEHLLSSLFQGATIQQPNGFSGSLGASANDILGLAAPIVVPGQTFEITVDCRASQTVHGVYAQSTFITFPADGVSAWSTSSQPPSGPAATTTTLTPATQTVGVGGNATVTAHVAPSSAAGSVQFKDGSTNLGSPIAVSGGTAVFSTTSLSTGSHSITGTFVPTDSSAFSASTSAPVTVIVTSGNVQAETINVNVPQSQGPFIMTVSTTPVSLGTAALSSDFTHFSASGTIGDVSVSDERNQTVPGWTITGQVSAFSDGTHTIPGTSLGWGPLVKTQNTAGDIVAGSAVTAGSNPGLTAASTLASAGVGKGLHNSVLSASLDFEAPASSQPGAYSATLTITAMP